MQKVEVTLVGQQRCGKTCVLISYTCQAFPGEYVPETCDLYTANVLVDGKPITLVLVKDTWIPELKSKAEGKPYVLIGLKADLREDQDVVNDLQKRKQSPVTKEEAQKMAKEVGAVFYLECSALTQRGLKEVFDESIRVVLGGTSKKEKEKDNCLLQ